jgi:type II secretory ATPase GspE/PulE/Tfp pilus assembly ATPase PilB-like protein
VFQVWPVEEASYDMILQGSDEHALRAHLHEIGVRSLLKGGLEKAEAGITDLAELRTIGIQAYRERKEVR